MPLKNTVVSPTSIVVKTRFVGFHSWPEAPDEVAFLRTSHRHEFWVEAQLPVKHDDRELEFFMVKSKLDEAVGLIWDKRNVGSCEMIARVIATALSLRYGRIVMVSVFEDGENGAEVQVG